MAKIAIVTEVDDQELWESVFGSAGTDWGSWWVEEKFLDGADWNKIGKVQLTVLNDEDEEVTKVIGLEDIVKALPIANEQVYMDLFNFANYDAICADAILQVAVLGEVVFG